MLTCSPVLCEIASPSDSESHWKPEFLLSNNWEKQEALFEYNPGVLQNIEIIANLIGNPIFAAKM